MLRRVAAALAMAATVVVAACESAPLSPGATHEEPVVAARWVADDGSVVAMNLVVPVGTDARRIQELAEQQRDTSPGARMIVRVFAATAGPERYVIGHVPARDEPLAAASPTPSVLALYDFPR